MKIIYYNWVSAKDYEKRGGVSVYQCNILNFFEKNSFRWCDVFEICSGVYYKSPFDKCFFKKEENTYKIFNSRVIAPAHASFGSLYQLEDNETESCFIDVLKDIGVADGDVVHFNNIEGVPVHLISRLKEVFKVKVIISDHNYYMVCPQVNLWTSDNKNCHNFDGGWGCVGCVCENKEDVRKDYEKKCLKSENMGWLVKTLSRWRIGFNRKVDKITKHLNKTGKGNQDIILIDNESQARYFFDRREYFLKIINNHADLILAVSERVRNILISMGYDSNKVKVSYIGTDQNYLYSDCAVSVRRKKFKIAYMGYMRQDKGFYFLLKALSSMPISMTKEIDLLVAARSEELGKERLFDVSRKFKSFSYYNGYSRDQEDDILNDVDLGIICPLWEDNLPQVAIEMHCRGIPILTSDVGGASELHLKNEDFIFKSGDINDFIRKLKKIFKQEVDFSRYYKNRLRPISIEEHIHKLMDIYKNC